MRVFRTLMIATASVCLLACAACGNPAAPQPPSLMLPVPVTDLSATRTGDQVTLHWTTTRRTTDKVLLKGDQRAEICRALESGPCRPAGVILTSPNAGADFTDTLPLDLRQGPLRLLRYEVRLANHAGRDAGSSNEAYAAAGSAPPAVEHVDAEATRAGISVQWKTAAAPAPDANARLIVRMVRERVLRRGESAQPTKLETQAGVPQRAQQTLEALEHPPSTGGTQWLPDHTLDAGAALNRRYRYTVQLVEQLKLGAHPVEVAGMAAQSMAFDATDTFPPSVPADLAAVANQQGGTIDLSWSADSDPDLAGYFVYRHIAGDDAAPERISGTAPLTGPSWSDAHPKPGVRYAYSVSAVNANGRESARSPEVVEALRTADAGQP